MNETTAEIAETVVFPTTRSDGVPLKKVVIARRPGFREGVTWRFVGQLVEPMTEEERSKQADGEFEPEPISEGVDIELEIPPLNFKLLKELRPQLDRLKETPDLESYEALIEILSLALTRNYRGIPRWLIESSVDFANLADITAAVMDVSGLKRKEQQEKKALAMAAASNGAGTQSTSTSSR